LQGNSLTDYALMKGMPMADVSKFLGHKSVGITDKYYGHITDKGQDAAVVAAGALPPELLQPTRNKRGTNSNNDFFMPRV
jgi:hypothetical protein